MKPRRLREDDDDNEICRKVNATSSSSYLLPWHEPECEEDSSALFPLWSGATFIRSQFRTVTTKSFGRRVVVVGGAD